MAIPKVIGTETEYGISAVGAPDFNPVLSSSLLISTYAGALRRIRWDYEQESPLRDARGFEPVQVREPAEEDLGLANVILPNGARYYVDHAHPEYSTPECASPRQLVVHDKAGERVLERSLVELHHVLPPGQRIAIYKNNSDGKGNSYGTHENFPVVPWCLRSQLAGAGVDLPGNKERGQIPHDVAERRAPVDQEILVGAVRVPLAVDRGTPFGNIV